MCPTRGDTQALLHAPPWQAARARRGRLLLLVNVGGSERLAFGICALGCDRHRFAVTGNPHLAGGVIAATGLLGFGSERIRIHLLD